GACASRARRSARDPCPLWRHRPLRRYPLGRRRFRSRDRQGALAGRERRQGGTVFLALYGAESATRGALSLPARLVLPTQEEVGACAILVRARARDLSGLSSLLAPQGVLPRATPPPARRSRGAPGRNGVLQGGVTGAARAESGH